MKKKLKKVKVSIGIPAYNEQENIARLLKVLLAQKQSNFSLLEIIVISDASTDKTNSILKSIDHPKIKIVIGKERIGQQMRQNQILSIYKGDILVLLEADTLPYNNRSIGELIKPFMRQNQDSDLGMVVGTPVFVSPKKFFEKILYQGHQLKMNIFWDWKKGLNVYTCSGYSMKAFTRSFSKNFNWPRNVPEDAYIYFSLKQLGLRFLRQKNAKAYVGNIASLNDHLMQVSKFVSGRQVLNRYFPEKMIHEEYKIPNYLILKHTILEFLRNPVLTIIYLGEFALNRALTINAPKFSAKHAIYTSSKTLKPDSSHIGNIDIQYG